MIKQKFLFDFVAKFAIQIITALAGIVVARLAGPSVMGMVNYGTSYVGVFSFIVGIFGTAHIKMVSEGKDEGDCNKTYWMISLSAIVVFLICTLSYFFIQKYYLHHNFGSADLQMVILLSIVAYVIGLFPQYNETFFIARTEQVRSNLPNLLKAVVYNVLRIVVVALGFGAIALVNINILSGLIVLPFIYVLFRKIPFGRFNKQYFRNYMLISLPVVVIVFTNALMAYSDKLVLEYYSNVKELGYYSVAFSIGGMILLLGKSAGTVFFPLFSKYFSDNDFDSVRKLSRKFDDFLFKFVFPFVLLLSMYSPLIIKGLLGPKYASSVDIFSILVVASFIMLWGTPYGNMLAGLGKFWLVAKINVFQFLFFAACLVLLLDPHFLGLKSMGLAINNLLLNLFSLVVSLLYAYRRTKIRFDLRLRYILFGAIFYFLWYLGCKALLDHSYKLIYYISPLFFIIVFYTFMYLMKWIERKDARFLFSLFNPKALSNYVKDEM
ncbi:MAG: oligosaccharide flippase family protein [Bacteroidetes bacterium]|nr:oligosaccharide flippase family protein [Bacteroidota bacterium]